MNADGAAVKHLEAAAVGVLVLVARWCPQRFSCCAVKGLVLGEDRSLHRVLRAISARDLRRSRSRRGCPRSNCRRGCGTRGLAGLGGMATSAANQRDCHSCGGQDRSSLRYRMHFVPFEPGRTHHYSGVADGESNVEVALRARSRRATGTNHALAQRHWANTCQPRFLSTGDSLTRAGDSAVNIRKPLHHRLFLQAPGVRMVCPKRHTRRMITESSTRRRPRPTVDLAPEATLTVLFSSSNAIG